MAHGHRTAELRSIELHRLIAQRMSDAVVERAQTRVDGWLADEDAAVPDIYAQAWLDLLNGPLEQLLKALVEDSPRMRDLRQSTPFAGVLDDEERLSVIRRVR